MEFKNKIADADMERIKKISEYFQNAKEQPPEQGSLTAETQQGFQKGGGWAR